MKQAKRILSLLLSLCLVLGLFPSTAFAASGNLPFTDVNTSDWYYDAVQYAYEKGMMNGTSTTTFSPNDTTTRGMIVTILHRIEGTPAAVGTAFTDVPAGQWYSDAVSWASANGIVGGYGNALFGPGDPITREQMAAILNRYSQHKGYDTNTSGSIAGFSDASQVSSYAVDPMGWAIGNGLISGVGNNTLAPKGNATRAQVATILMRFCKNIADKANSRPTPDTTVEKTYTVTFDLNYGSATRYDVKTVKEGETVSKPSNPSRSGYSFSGWYAEKSGGRQFDFSTSITSDLTLYAHWTARSSSSNSGGSGWIPSGSDTTVYYAVTFNANGENVENLPQVQTIKAGECATEPAAPSREGYVFGGWFTDLTCMSGFSFTSAITSNIVLYAYWLKLDSVDQSDTTDSDDDGVPDWVEQEFGADPMLDDTDGDGLSDYDEIFVLSSNPAKQDSDGNGIFDSDEDFDGDTITNIVELANGTNPVSADTDGDGLNDNVEAVYGTNPLEADSDNDGAEDGWEVSNGFDPLIFNDSFNITLSADIPTNDVPVTAGVVSNIHNITRDVVVSPVSSSDNALLSSSIAGYIGPAYDFYTDGSFEIATITFRYDTSLGKIGDDFQPRIYYFNEEDGTFDELANQIVSDGQVSVEVSHFSTYILLNKVDVDAIWEAEIKPPLSDGEYDEDTTLDIVFVIDYSASMSDNDPKELCKQLSKEFVSKLRDGKDFAAVIKFIRRATVVSNLTTDKNILNTAIDSITYDNGHGSYSGTDGSTGIKSALDCLSVSDSEYQYIIFITDGEDNGYTYSYDTLISDAVDRGVVIYTVGMGTATENVLRGIANRTGGKYYHATTSVDTEDLIDLEEVFKDIESETVDLTTDTNNDGIPDYYNNLIMNGDLVLSNGSRMFFGIDFNYDLDGYPSDDWDHDGLKNGEELQIIQNGDRVYLKMLSSPISRDTDDDGIDDSRDSAPMKKGLSGGVIGNLSLISCYNSEDAGWTSGHVFFVYTSYVKDTIDFSTLAAGWSKIDTSGEWSWANLQRDNPLLSEYVFAVGESATIGNGAFDSGWFGIGDGSGSSGSSGGSSGDSSASGTGDENGVCYNMEVYKHLNKNIGYSYLNNTYISKDITESELRELIEYCSKGSVNYWNLVHNCAEVACKAWNLISSVRVSPYSGDFLFGKVATPKGLKINLRTITGSAENYSLANALNP